MEFTDYGKALAKSEPHMPNPENLSGASLHVLATKYDSGLTIVLTGRNVHSVRFHRNAKSVYGAYAMAQSLWGVNSAWHIREDGTRKLIFRR